MSGTYDLRNTLRRILGRVLSSPHVRRATFSPAFEERAEDIRIGNIPRRDLELIYRIDSVTPQVADRIYFVDGTLRTVHIGDIECRGIHVPIFLSQIVAGATLRENTELSPYRIFSKFVVLAPSRALSDANCYGIYMPQNITLDYTGDFYSKIINNDVLFVDTSLKFQSRQNQPLQSIRAEELTGTGRLRSAARNKAKVVMRIMELLLAYETTQRDRNGLVVMDGPIGLLLPYSRLTGVINIDVDEFPTDSYTSQAQQSLYDFLSRIVGIVKNVEIIPTDLFNQLAGIPFYFFPQVGGLVRDPEEDVDKDDLRSYILAGYIQLRPNLLREVSSIWSTASALIRIDVPLPAVTDPSISNSWLSYFKQTLEQTNLPLPQVISNYINSTTHAQQRLAEIVSYIAGEAYPVPSTSPHRMLVELYSIAETEYWIKSRLIPAEELASLI
ncbi:MAG: hypothetical protein J7L47_05965 [Candidatus Odinarchaeota archaeon]|nr:hypothetical protein [Candidatus Odinarchaeota archaeon]